jgi:hypothetical protein
MIAYTFLLIIVLVCMINSSKFLMQYLKIKRTGLKTEGLIVAFITRRQIMLKNALIPKFSFSTQEGKEVISVPLHTFFVEVLGYHLNQEYELMYVADNPDAFIVCKPAEFLISIAVIALSIAYTAWFIYMAVSNS